MWKRHCNYSFCAYSSYLNFIKGTRKTLMHEVWLYRSNSIVMLLLHSMQRLLIFLEFVTSIILPLLLKAYLFAIISFNPLFSLNWDKLCFLCNIMFTILFDHEPFSWQLPTWYMFRLKGILKLFSLTADVDMLFKIFIELYPYMVHAIQQKK